MTDDNNASESHDTDNSLGELQLTTTEARILGCLVEKESTTPEQYPLTQNAILTACNQKTSRDPVMNLEAGQIGHALRQLETRGLVKTVFGSRADRFEHRLSERYSLTRDQQAVLTLLMLRGPQTAGELLGRSERLHRFDGADAVHHALDRLAQREPSLVIRIPRGPGQREDRYAHCLCGEPDISALPVASSESPSSRGAAARIDELELRVAELESIVARLTSGD
ncbi:MAG TPA: YceH family protein [Xanthomonadaceae bacterium]|nr:YceH family protein [Xanthomonadaceae bacterium]HRY01275.1 YceH family protein [Xanthomonadaceae bacterium]